MSAKWLRPTGTEIEYGRRPYISGKETSYVDMMAEVTDKARLDQGEFPLSEFKKPYLAKDYEQMEYQFSDMAALTPLKPWRVNFPEAMWGQVDVYGSRGHTGRLRWKIEPPDEGESEHWYLIEVWNRLRETSQTSNGKVTKYTRTYYPAWFEMKKTKPKTKGFKLEVWLPNAAIDARGSIAGFWHGGNVWYNVEKQAGVIRAIIGYMWERGYARPTMTAKLTLSAAAKGEVEIAAKDGKTTLREKTKIGTFLLLYLGEDGYYYSTPGLHPVTVSGDEYPTKKREGVTANPFIYSNSGDYNYYRVHTYRRTTVHYVENVTGYSAFLYPPEPWQTNSWWNFKYWNTAWTRTTTVVDVVESTDPSIESSETAVSTNVENGTSWWGGYTNVWGYSEYWWEDGSAPVLPDQPANVNTENASVTNEEENIYPVNDKVKISDGVYHVLDVSILAPTPDENTSIHWTATICPKIITDTGNSTRVYFMAMYDNNNPSSKAYYWIEHITTGSEAEFVFSGSPFTERSFEGINMDLSNVYY